MEKIGIITDSACDLSYEELNHDLVRVLPLKIAFSDGEYKDGVTITPEEVYIKMDREIPKTSLPDGKDMQDAIDWFKDRGFTNIIGIFISSGLSGTMNAFRNLASSEEGIAIEVVDTKELSYSEGISVMLAQKMITEGKSVREIIAAVKNVKKKVDTYFVLDTLEYLIKGGRIGKVAGTIGQLLNIKPIIHVNEEGIYHTVSKARGKKQSVQKLLQYIEENHLSKGRYNIHVVHGGVPEEGEEVKKQLESMEGIERITLRPLTPSLSVHTGKGLVGLIAEEL